MHLTQAQCEISARERGARAVRGCAAALAPEDARARAGRAPLERHLAAAQLAGPLRVGREEKAPARVATLGAANRLQTHAADGVHGHGATIANSRDKRNQVRTHTFAPCEVCSE